MIITGFSNMSVYHLMVYTNNTNNIRIFMETMKMLI
jgi:hypothetical protein